MQKKTKQKSKAKAIIVTAILILVAALIAFGFYSSRHLLSVSHFTIDRAEIDTPIRIVQLTDLHNSVFGEENSRLLERVAAEKPDMILLTGDLLNQNEERTDIVVDLITELVKIAPVYASYGNHEVKHEKNFGTDFHDLYGKAGAVIFDYDYIEITVHGQDIRLGGMYGYCVPPDGLRKYQKQIDYLTAFQDTDATTVLLCHLPASWLSKGRLDVWDVDVIFAGHAHGGQVRIPLIGGLWAPDQGWFPGRECGLYYSEDKNSVLVLSRGLGSNQKIPRFNNIPEIVVVDLV